MKFAVAGDEIMDLFLIILLIVAGYFILWSWIMSHTGRRWSVSTMLLVALVIYIPVLCMGMVLVQYLGNVGMTLYAVAAVYSCLYWPWKLYHIIAEKMEITLRILLFLAAYLLALLYITIFMRESGMSERLQMEVFHWIHTGRKDSFTHVFQNIVLFVPVGFLCAALPKTQQKVFVMSMSFGLLLSVLIETAQFVFRFGICDIDDIISNLAGAAIGAGIVSGWNRRKAKSEVKG